MRKSLFTAVAAFAHGVQTVTTDVPQKMLDEHKAKK